MRTTYPYRAASIHFFPLLSAVLVSGGAVLACKSIHIDPDASATTGTGGNGGTTTATTSAGGNGGTTTTTVATGGGGSAPVGECESNSDCPFPKAVCDVAQAKCVECATFTDCAFRPGTVCSEGACVCPNLGADGKPDPAFQFCPAFGGQGNRCVNIQTSKDDCGECAHPCFGSCDTGACVDPWEPTSNIGAPEPRRDHVAVWDPNEKVMVIWGGFDGNKALDSGGIYNPETRLWTKTSVVDAPSPRFNATAVWDSLNGQMIVWGGRAAGAPLGTGGVFNPKMNKWKPLPLNVSAPSPRWNHTAVWMGPKMIVWGGFDGTTYLSTGAIYNANAAEWLPLASAAPAPTGREGHTAVWRTGVDTMFIWGGFDGTSYLGDGALYSENAGWSSLNPAALGTPPTARANHTAVWNNASTLLWGGADGAASFADGSSHNAVGDWIPLNPSNNVPEPRRRHTAVWVNSRMIVWGGENDPSAPHKYFDNGFSIADPASPWIPLPIVPLAGRAQHTAVVNSVANTMILWGGLTDAGVTNTGAIFTAK